MADISAKAARTRAGYGYQPVNILAYGGTMRGAPAA